MRPYIAIIKDSFRAAMASWVLYVLLLLITILLLVLAPLHMRETLDWKLIMEQNVRRPDEIARRLVERHEDSERKGVIRIWSRLPDKLKETLKKIQVASNVTASPSDETDQEINVKVGERPAGAVEEAFAFQELVEELNKQIQDRDFYRPEDWEGRVDSSEASALIEQGVENLSEERSRRLNRLLITQALSPGIETGRTALEFWYATWKWDFLTTSSTHQQFAQQLTKDLPWYFDKFVLSIGLFVAILVTANMIPETFEPGSLNLLLSKPVSRWGLFLSKFVGGCVFICLCAGYLFLGIWLWLGLAMSVWDKAILYSIPLYIIVFAIYFSVSALVGLISRSAIVAVVLTLIFWATCFVAGSVHGFFSTKMANNELFSLMAVDDQVYSTDIVHQLERWDDSQNAWDPVLEADLGDEGTVQLSVQSFMVPLRNLPILPGIMERLGPVFDAERRQIFASPYVFRQMMSSSRKQLFVSDADAIDFKAIGLLPRETQDIMASSRGLVAVTRDGEFFRLDHEAIDAYLSEGDSEEKTSSESSNEDAAEGIADEATPDGDNNVDSEAETESTAAAQDTDKKDQDFFQPCGPDQRVSVRNRNLVALNPQDDRIAVYRKGALTVYQVGGDGQYTQFASLDLALDFDRSMSCMIEFKGNTVLLVYGNGKVISVNATTLTEQNEYQPESRSAIAELTGSEDGRFFALRYRNGNLWILDEQEPEKMSFADVVGQGKVCALGFGADDQLWVADNTDRATVYSLASQEQGVRHAPGGTWIEKSYRYAISPLYRIFPKPGEFYKVVTYLSSSGDTSDNKDVDLVIQPLEITDPWGPLWSGLGFMGVILLFACTIFHFKDF